MLFWRKSTLLCKQDVRRSIAFSTVQISIPGISCARSSGGIAVTTVNANAEMKQLRFINPSKDGSHQIEQARRRRRYHITTSFTRCDLHLTGRGNRAEFLQ